MQKKSSGIGYSSENFPNSYPCNLHSSAMLNIHIKKIKSLPSDEDFLLVWHAVWQKSCSKTFTCVSVVLLCSDTLQGARMAGGCAGGKARTHPWKLCGDTVTPKRTILTLLFIYMVSMVLAALSQWHCLSFSILLHTKDIEREYILYPKPQMLLAQELSSSIS